MFISPSGCLVGFGGVGRDRPFRVGPPLLGGSHLFTVGSGSFGGALVLSSMSIVFWDFYTLLDVFSERNTSRRVFIGLFSVSVTPAVLAVLLNCVVNTTSS